MFNEIAPLYYFSSDTDAYDVVISVLIAAADADTAIAYLRNTFPHGDRGIVWEDNWEIKQIGVVTITDEGHYPILMHTVRAG